LAAHAQLINSIPQKIASTAQFMAKIAQAANTVSELILTLSGNESIHSRTGTLPFSW